jgi:hypothetical protein
MKSGASTVNQILLAGLVPILLTCIFASPKLGFTSMFRYEYLNKSLYMLVNRKGVEAVNMPIIVEIRVIAFWDKTSINYYLGIIIGYDIYKKIDIQSE